ncbi:DUF6929 family protein [Hymenobacter wooponensis]|uniref:Uncharacterized protein n=1 Tax=Hymenobacter wooponensis TaxID=1525360 RepID=A0A4Z0MSA2_9BACT|nr:hypothetical protein [Hymenobacter wooponensis]TGD82683.1 hypothetical protein EU557_02560 [Hymenobacter wooponensis]
MRALIQHEATLPNLPSASGIEVVGEVAYIIGDDSPFLYQLNAASLAAGERTSLFETVHFSTGRIPKDLKLDLECLTVITTDTGETGLLLMGSGATSAREQGFWVTLAKEGSVGSTVYPVSLSGLYAALRQHLPTGITLNLEAVAATPAELIIFQRTVGSAAGNLAFRMPLAQTLHYLHHQTQAVPPIQTQFYELPTIDGKPAGFSGATWFGDQLFVTASVEDTQDAVQDGAVLGSLVGIVDLSKTSARPVPVTLARLELPNGQAYRGKVESVAVRRRVSSHTYELLLVTDDDLGGSTAVTAVLTV